MKFVSATGFPKLSESDAVVAFLEFTAQFLEILALDKDARFLVCGVSSDRGTKDHSGNNDEIEYNVWLVV